jgi:pimeloyl-ACP methyl ester carboxylesterase
MKVVVFLPGIMGSELRSKASGKRVWPPTLLEIITKNANIDDLLEPTLEATRPISAVAGFYSVYRSLLRDIEDCGYKVDGSERRFIAFAYDWRQSNEDTAQLLSDRLNQENDIEEIVLLGHSMGGLIARYCLESGRFNEQAWFPKVSQLITLGTPHNGAPAALNQVSGLGANLGLRAADVKRLASDDRYPSAYQLVPPNGTSMVLRQANRHKLPKLIKPFDADIIIQFSLNQNNIDASTRFWSALNISARPVSVDYFSFIGSAHKTLYRLDWNGRDLVQRESNDSGDGTVPTASCLNVAIPHSFSRKKHVALFADRDVRVQLYKMLGAEEGIRPHSANGEVNIASTTAMGMSTDKEEYLSQDIMEVAVSYATAQTNPRCRFQLAQVNTDLLDNMATNENMTLIGEPISVNFDGANVSNFKFNFELDLPAGVYELQASADMDDPERTFFMVSEADNSEIDV